MTRCVIHIGMHKTGSTSIQNSLQGFGDDRFLYADLGHAANHSLAIYSVFASEPQRHHLHQAHGRDAAALLAYITGMRTDLEDAISAAEDRTLLISGEDISVLPQADLVKLREYFRARFDDLAIVGYVRPPAGYMASAFQESVKGGVVDRLDLEREYRNYQETFAKFDEVFGRENVRLWKFDPKTFPGGCAVRDFCSRLGIALPAERIVRLNESLSRQAVILLYTYRKLGKKYGSGTMTGGESHQLGTLLGRTGNDKFRFSPDAVRPVLDRHRADIEWMEARLGQPLHEEPSEHQPGDVRHESDFLHPGRETVARLLAMLGDHAPAGVTGETPEEAALLVHALRTRPKPGTTGAVQTRNQAKVNMGRIMLAEPNLVAGWAIGADPGRPVRVSLLINGEKVADVVADKARPALKDKGIHPTGQCGFVFRFEADKRLQAGNRVAVEPVDGNFAIANSPLVLGDCRQGGKL